MLGGSYYTMTCEIPFENLVSNLEVLKSLRSIEEDLVIRGHHECDTYTLELKPPDRVLARKWGENGGLLGERELEALEVEFKKLVEDIEKKAVAESSGLEVNVKHLFRETAGIVRGEVTVEVIGTLEDLEKIVETLRKIGVICEEIGKLMIKE